MQRPSYFGSNKRDGGGFDQGFAAKRPRGNEGGNLGNDPNLLAAVGQLIAAATSGAPNSSNQLAQLLASALSNVQQPEQQAPMMQMQQHGGGGSSHGQRMGKWDAVVIPTICVGWLKGKQGAMIKEIESRSGATVDIDQTTKDMGHCTVNMHGDEEAKRKAYGFVVAEMLKVADQPGSNMDCSAIGTRLSLNIDAKFVGWVKGPKGKVVQDITGRSNTRVDVDQTRIHEGQAIINIYGTHENVQYGRELIAFEISKVDPEVATQINGVPLQGVPALPASHPGGGNQWANAPGGGPNGTLEIPSSYVGWLKGRQGQMIRDIEAKSGATVDIDQTTKDLGHCTVNIRGPEDQKKKAFGLVVAEVMKVSDQSGVPLDQTQVGTKIEIPIDGKFVGWVKGPKGKVVQDISARSNTRIDVVQPPDDLARAIVKIFGTHEGVQCAKDLVAFEISKVSPEAAAEIQGSGGMFANDLAQANSMIDGAPGIFDSGPHASLTIPASYVGWIKGKQGAMVRDIEARSGAVVDIDQTTKELGHVQVNFRGDDESKRKAYGLIVAEVVKVTEQGGQGSQAYDCTEFGTKLELRIEGQFVGWVKGPRGKVVQDISTRSSTRIDMDQTDQAFATVKVYGTHEGVQAAKEFIAFEISKVSPEAAAEINAGHNAVLGMGNSLPPLQPMQQPMHTHSMRPMQSMQPMHSMQPQMGSPLGMQSMQAPQMAFSHAQPPLQAPRADLSNITSLVANALQQPQMNVVNAQMSGQQAAAAQLTQQYLQQLQQVAPNMVSIDQQQTMNRMF